MRTVPEFLAALHRLRLLDDAQLDALGRPAQPSDPRVLARQLVQQGVLTAFQVNRLFTGRGDELLLGSYVLLELLGEGGMGAVYKARNWKLGAIVALKLIRKERLTNDAAVKRFEREIRASAQLHHPNIVRAIDADAVGGVHFLVMEYIDGGQDLYKLVKQQGPLPIEQACTFIRQAALGLQQAHERGLVHRDIKPHNLIVSVVQDEQFVALADDDGRRTTDHCVKILDFGLARLGESEEDSSTLTQEGAVMGTLDYLAPEQARDTHGVDIRADLYSLGCTLYFLLTGRAPFAGGAAGQKMYRHQFEEPAAIESLRPEVPAALSAVVRRLMAKQPEARYPTPAALAVELEAVLSHRAVVALRGPEQSRSASESSLTVPITYNSCAQPSDSETTADGAATDRGAPARPARAAQVRRRHWRWLLACAGCGVAIVIMLAVGAVLLRANRAPRKAAEPELTLPKPGKQTAQEMAAAEQKRKQRDADAQQKWLAQEAQIRQRRADDAEQSFKPLQAQFQTPGVTFASFAPAVRAFTAKHGGTPAAIRAAELLMKLPSPLDRLEPNDLPQDDTDYWQAQGQPRPPELVGVLGEHRGRCGAIVRRISYSPDGKLLAVSDNDRHIHLVDAATLRLRHRLQGASAVFTPDGKLLALDGGGIVRWEFEGGVPKETVLVKEAPSARMLAITHDGHLLATAHPLRICLWDLTGPAPRARADLPWPGGNIDVPCFDPDGKRLIAGNHDKTVRLWDVTTEPAKDIATLTGHGDWVYDVAISPNGKTVASAGAHDRTVRLWDLEPPTPKPGAVMHMDDAVCSVAFSPDNKTLAVGLWNGEVWLGDLTAEGPKRRFVFRGHAGVVWALAFLPGLRTLATGSQDGTVRLWDVDTGKEVQPLTGPVGAMRSLALSPDDGQLVAGGAAKQVLLWDVRSRKPPRVLDGTFDKEVHAVGFSADGKQILGRGYNTIAAWDRDSGRQAREFTGQDAIATMFFAHNPHRACLLYPDYSWRLWDVDNYRALTSFPGHTKTIRFLDFSPEASRVLTSSDDGSVRLWHAPSGKELHRLNTVLPVDRLAYSPDGMSAYYSLNSGAVGRWDLHDDHLAERWSYRARNVPIESIAVSADGKLLATSDLSGRLMLWDGAAGNKLHEWQFPCSLHGVAFAHDGRHLAFACSDGIIDILRIAEDIARSKQ